MNLFPRLAVTKCYTLVGLNNRYFLPRGSGGYKPPGLVCSKTVREDVFCAYFLDSDGLLTIFVGIPWLADPALWSPPSGSHGSLLCTPLYVAFFV